jgi:putative Ig domain-containing protein/VCBS repeat protein
MNFLKFWVAGMLPVLATVLALASTADAAVATWSANVESDVAGYKLSYGKQSGVHTVVIDVGKVTTYTFNPPAGFRYYVVVQAYNTKGQLSDKSAEVVIDVPATNLPPAVSQPANQTNTVNTNVSFTFSASDPEGKALTFSATGLPPGLAISATRPVIAGSPRTVGVYQVTVIASDGALTTRRSFTWTIKSPPIQAPTLVQPPNQTSKVDVNVSLALSASSATGKTLKFSATGLPAGLSINADAGIISGIPRTAGTYQVTATVSDGTLATSRSFSWTVTQASSSTTLVLPAQDTTLLLNAVNQSAQGTLTLYTWPANRVSANILMKFNLSRIPTNAVIESAALTMSLTAFDNTADSSYSVSLHQVIKRSPVIAKATGYTADGVTAWTANSCCSSSVPMAMADISLAKSTVVVDRSLGKKTWNAAALVKAWVATPSTNLGLLLKADTSKGEGRYRIFGSNENPTASNRPSLRVTYSVPAAPAVATLAGATVVATGDSSMISARSIETSASVAESGPVVEDPSAGLSGDFDGDGRADLATYQRGEWRIWTSSSQFLEPTIVTWGEAGDVPVPADYNGDHVTDLALYRPSTATWLWWLPDAKTPSTVRWGVPGDRPLTMDYDGDGKADLALARDGAYLILLSSTNYTESATIY